MKEKESATFKIDHDFSDTNFDTAVLQIDFAENYSTFYQDEVQLAYWVETQITIFIKRLAGRHVVTYQLSLTLFHFLMLLITKVKSKFSMCQQLK